MQPNQMISWFPGHMAKARRQLQDLLKRVDLVVEVCDARLPLSSRNPDLNELAAHKKRLLLLNKADLADPAQTALWLSRFQDKGLTALAIKANKDRNAVLKAIERLTAHKTQRAIARGFSKPARAMVVGVPNVGKSTLINAIAGRSAFKVQDRPGVTRAAQWIKVSDQLELLDTPGMLWPKLNDQQAAKRLAYIAAVRDEVVDVYHLALGLLSELMSVKPKGLMERYNLADDQLAGQALMEAICRSRGFLLKGGECDLLRGAVCVLDEFRAGKLGRITLESPEQALAEG